MIVRHMARYGIVVDIDNVLITSGSQQALDLIGKVLINPGDKLLIENPTYLGALQAFTMYGADFVTVPIDDDGMVTDKLEDALRCGPEVHLRAAELPEPVGRHDAARAAAGADPAVRSLRHPDHRGRPLRSAALRGRAHQAAGRARRRVPRVRPQREVHRQRHLPQHLQQDAGARAADGVGGRRRRKSSTGWCRPSRAPTCSAARSTRWWRTRSAAAGSSTGTCTGSARSTGTGGTSCSRRSRRRSRTRRLGVRWTRPAGRPVPLGRRCPSGWTRPTC